MTVVLLVHAAATWFMCGVIWFVQVVHYPLFTHVGAATSAAYARANQRRTTAVVLPAMLVELACAGWLAWSPPAGTPPWQPQLGLALLGVIWTSTLLLQVPAHARLSAGPDEAAVGRLVRTNWIRTAAWSTRGVLALGMLG
jgi:hypothetical protein